MDWTEERIGLKETEVVSLVNSLKISNEEGEKSRIAVDRMGSGIRD